uniref:Uncharacterized protein n=1 Tax=Aegilops tauschii subsp. strangulata TaxID=200361 RepID=A0A453JAV3_AEGTS
KVASEASIDRLQSLIKLCVSLCYLWMKPDRIKLLRLLSCYTLDQFSEFIPFCGKALQIVLIVWNG